SGYGCGGSSLQVDPSYVSVTTNVLTLLALAYGKDCVAAAKYGLLTGGPAWVSSEQFTIRATIPEGSPSYTRRQLLWGRAPELQAMLRALLADRFKLAVHNDTTGQQAYALTVARGGPKLTPFKEGSCDYESRLMPGMLAPGSSEQPPCYRGVFVNLQSHFEVIATGVTLDSFA